MMKQKTIYLMLAVVAVLLAVSTQLANAQAPTPAPQMPKEDVITDDKYLPRDDVKGVAGGVIDIMALAYVAGYYGTNNPAADVNGDGLVDIKDLAILGSNYNRTAPEAGALAIPTATPAMPTVDVGKAGDDFGKVLVSVAKPETNAQANLTWRPLKVGVGIDHVYTWDLMDGQTSTPPDFYTWVSVGGTTARTATWWNSADIWPYWLLGWWQYAEFPRFAVNDPAGNNYPVPIIMEMRDDDGQFCYGYLGCRVGYETADLSPVPGQRLKRLAFFPASCYAIDEAGVKFDGLFDSTNNRCRINLTSWGNEWPRASVSYHLDAMWE